MNLIQGNKWDLLNPPSTATVTINLENTLDPNSMYHSAGEVQDMSVITAIHWAAAVNENVSYVPGFIGVKNTTAAPKLITRLYMSSHDFSWCPKWFDLG